MEKESTPKENIVVIRPSFKKVCGNDACRAALFNHLLYNIGGKVASGGDYWYETLDDIHKGIDRSWCISKMRNELDKLIAQGIIGQRHNPQKKWDRTLQYFFGEEEAKKLKAICKKLEIDLSSVGLPDQIMHLLYITNAFDENNKCKCQICQMDLLKTTNPFVKNNGAIPKDTPKVSLPKDTPKETNTSPVHIVQARKRSTLQAKLLSLETFDFEQEVTIETIMFLGDCWRGGPLPVVKRADSDYQKALMQGATPLSQRQRPNGKRGYTLREIDIAYRFYKRIAPKDKPWLVADDWWIDKPVDLWVIAKNIDKALTSIAKLEKEHNPNQPQLIPEQDETEKTTTVAWSKHPECLPKRQKDVLPNFDLYESMTVAEARKYGWDESVALTPNLQNDVLSRLELWLVDGVPLEELKPQISQIA